MSKIYKKLKKASKAAETSSKPVKKKAASRPPAPNAEDILQTIQRKLSQREKDAQKEDLRSFEDRYFKRSPEEENGTHGIQEEAPKLDQPDQTQQHPWRSIEAFEVGLSLVAIAVFLGVFLWVHFITH